MKLESPKVTLNKSAETVFDFLQNVENFEKIMPKNKSKFKVLSDSTFVFALSGMPEITLKLQEKKPVNKIVFGSDNDKFAFTLTGDIFSVAENTCGVQLNFEGNFNPMMAMMIKAPISKFIASLADNLAKL